MNPRRFLFPGIVAASVALVQIPVHAVLLESESFDYPSNTGQGLNGLNGGTGWGTNAWVDADSLPTLAATHSSLDYPEGTNLVSSGGRIELTLGATNNPVQRTLGTSMSLATNGLNFYSSALFRRSAVTGELASVLFDRTSDGVTRWYYGIDESGFFSVAVNPSDVSQRATSTFTAAADTTYLVVARIRTNTGAAGTDQVFLKVYPEGSTITEPASDAEWDLTASGGSTVTLDRMRLAFSNAAGQTNQFDELRIGTTFADVAGIPEPGAFALLALGSLALARRRRR